MATKFSKKTVSVMELTVDLTLNVREPNNYDVESMKDQILEVGRITNPPIVKETKDAFIVLQGNRRVKAGQSLFEDPNCPSQAKEALTKMEILVLKAEDLSPEEEMRIICDHGSQKPISKTETVKTVWRLARSLFSEKQIITLLYYQLARYSGNEKKVSEMPTEAKAKELFLSKWLHGTVGNYMLSVLRMPERVREQFVLTHKAMDGLLVNGEKVTVKVSRERVVELSKAKTADEKENKWNPGTGGPNFDAQWQKFVKEDAGEITVETPKRPSIKELKGLSDIMESELTRKIILACVGEAQANLADLDKETARQASIFRVLAEQIDAIKDAKVKEVVNTIFRGTAKEVESYLSTS